MSEDQLSRFVGELIAGKYLVKEPIARGGFKRVTSLSRTSRWSSS